MPQMMPCSWMVVFFSSILVFLIINSCWSVFFFLHSFPMEKQTRHNLSKNFFH